jgi:hypothetical protein
VCGYGREERSNSIEFVPLHRLKVLDQGQKHLRKV